MTCLLACLLVAACPCSHVIGPSRMFLLPTGEAPDAGMLSQLADQGVSEPFPCKLHSPRADAGLLPAGNVGSIRVRLPSGAASKGPPMLSAPASPSRHTAAAGATGDAEGAILSETQQ